MDHLLIHCHVANSLWVFTLQAFGIQWVLPSSVAELLFCWNHWLGKQDSDIWNLIPVCSMWTIWMECNRWSFEDYEKSLVELIGLCQRSVFDWSQCWGFTECSSIVQFFSSLSLVSWLFSVGFLFFALLCSFSWTHCMFIFPFSSIIILKLPIKKKILRLNQTLSLPPNVHAH